MLSFCPLDVLDEICDLIEAVSEGFLTYSFTLLKPTSTKMDGNRGPAFRTENPKYKALNRTT